MEGWLWIVVLYVLFMVVQAIAKKGKPTARAGTQRQLKLFDDLGSRPAGRAGARREAPPAGRRPPVAAPTRPPARRPLTLEEVLGLNVEPEAEESVFDYDEEATAVAEARLRPEVAEPEAVSLEERGLKESAERDRPIEALALGGAAEHGMWRMKLEAQTQRDLAAAGGQAAEQARRRASGPRALRFVSASVRDAVVWSEILGRPVSER